MINNDDSTSKYQKWAVTDRHYVELKIKFQLSHGSIQLMGELFPFVESFYSFELFVKSKHRKSLDGWGAELSCCYFCFFCLFIRAFILCLFQNVDWLVFVCVGRINVLSACNVQDKPLIGVARTSCLMKLIFIFALCHMPEVCVYQIFMP